MLTLGPQTQSRRQQRCQCSAFVLRDEYDCQKKTRPFALKVAVDLGAIFGWCYLRPKQGAEFCQFGRIRGFRTANFFGHFDMVARQMVSLADDFNFATEFTESMSGLLKWSAGAEGKFLTDETSQNFCLRVHCVNLPFYRM